MKKTKEFSININEIIEKFKKNINENPVISIICLNIMSEMLNQDKQST